MSALLGHGQAEAQPGATTPGQLLDELNRALRGQPQVWNWRPHLDPAFNSWRVGGSLNLPVVAAAVGLVRDPGGTNAVGWWTAFLTCQNAPGSCPVPNPGRLVHFKGNEIFANVYDWSVVNSVLTVNWWAHRPPGNVTLQNAARQYLRKTWSLWALGAGNGPARQYRDDRDESGRLVGDGSGSFVHRCQVNTGGQLFFNGPFLALPGTRSRPGQSCADDRGVLFAVAIAWPNLVNRQEHAEQAELRQFLEPRWQLNAYGESLYALNENDRTLLREHLRLGNQAAVLVSVIGAGGTRFVVPLYFVGWANGVRAGVMARCANRNGPGCIYAVKYDSAAAQAHILFPWTLDLRQFQDGYGRLLPSPLSPTRAEASNQADYEPCCPGVNQGNACGAQRHPCFVQWFDLPAESPLYRVLADETGIRLL